MRVKCATVVCSVGLPIALAVGGDPVIFDTTDNGNGVGEGLRSSQHSRSYGWRSGVADDFMLDPEYPTYWVTGVHWHGGWWNPGPPGNSTAFYVSFYEDVGGVPAGGGIQDPRWAASASFAITIDDISITPTGPDTEYYECELPLPAIIEADTTYWVEIVSENFFPPQWGWLDTTQAPIFGNPSVQGFPLLNMPFWEPIEPPSDRAFQLVGHGVPEPGAVLMFAMLGTCGVLRRRGGS